MTAIYFYPLNCTGSACLLQTYQFLKICRQLEQLRGIDAIFEFVINTGASLCQYVLDHNLAIECPVCGSFIDYIPKKKYCNANTDGRACDKKIRNQRSYERNKKKRQAESRDRMRLDREFYRKHK